MHDHRKIKQLREARGLTQSEAAKLADMKTQQWNDIESGRVGAKRGISLETLSRVARAVGAEAKDLLR